MLSSPLQNTNMSLLAQRSPTSPTAKLDELAAQRKLLQQTLSIEPSPASLREAAEILKPKKQTRKPSLAVQNCR